MYYHTNHKRLNYAEFSHRAEAELFLLCAVSELTQQTGSCRQAGVNSSSIDEAIFSHSYIC